jgi:hypothetical protein
VAIVGTGVGIVAVEVEEVVVILGEEVGVTEISIVVMGEASIEGARGTPGHPVDATHEIEAHLEGLLGNRIHMYPAAEANRVETIVAEHLPASLDHHLLPDQTLVPHPAADNGHPRDQGLRLLAGDLEHQTDEVIRIEAVGGGEEGEVQTVHPVEDLPLLRESHAHALQGHQNEEQSRTLSAHLLHLDLDELVATLVLYLGHHLDRLAEHLVEEYPAAERGLARLQRQILKRMPRIYALGVVNAG